MTETQPTPAQTEVPPHMTIKLTADEAASLAQDLAAECAPSERLRQVAKTYTLELHTNDDA